MANYLTELGNIQKMNILLMTSIMSKAPEVSHKVHSRFYPIEPYVILRVSIHRLKKNRRCRSIFVKYSVNSCCFGCVMYMYVTLALNYESETKQK